MRNFFIITYIYGKVKAGPVVRFLRYKKYFNSKNINPIFITRFSNKDELDNDKNVKYIDSNNVV